MLNDNPWTNDRAQRSMGNCGCIALIIYLVVTGLLFFGAVIYLATIGLQTLVVK